jgi:Mrp family chromosome partitioning ATPase
MVSLLEQLKEICDIVIIDGTPSQLVTDSLILTRLVDSTLIVIASKETKKEDLKRVITNIQNVGGKIAGVVINKMPISAKKYEQSYYYGSTSTRNMKTKNKKSGKNGYNRASTMVGQKNNMARNLQNQNIEQSKKNINTNTKINDASTTKNENSEMPKALQNNLKVDGKDEISLEKTNDILKQINEYLDQEKKKLN